MDSAFAISTSETRSSRSGRDLCMVRKNSDGTGSFIDRHSETEIGIEICVSGSFVSRPGV
jgi:hypothetical protein